MSVWSHIYCSESMDQPGKVANPARGQLLSSTVCPMVELMKPAKKGRCFVTAGRRPIIMPCVCMCDRASTIPSNILGCQSVTWSAGQENIRGTSTKLQRELIKTKTKTTNTKHSALPSTCPRYTNRALVGMGEERRIL